MAYRTVYKNLKHWNVEATRCINVWANGCSDANEMGGPNEWTNERMNVRMGEWPNQWKSEEMNERILTNGWESYFCFFFTEPPLRWVTPSVSYIRINRSAKIVETVPPSVVRFHVEFCIQAASAWGVLICWWVFCLSIFRRAALQRRRCCSHKLLDRRILTCGKLVRGLSWPFSLVPYGALILVPFLIQPLAFPKVILLAGCACSSVCCEASSSSTSIWVAAISLVSSVLSLRWLGLFTFHVVGRRAWTPKMYGDLGLLRSKVWSPVLISQESSILSSAGSLWQATVCNLLGRLKHCAFRPTCSFQSLRGIEVTIPAWGSCKAPWL